MLVHFTIFFKIQYLVSNTKYSTWKDCLCLDRFELDFISVQNIVLADQSRSPLEMPYTVSGCAIIRKNDFLCVVYFLCM